MCHCLLEVKQTDLNKESLPVFFSSCRLASESINLRLMSFSCNSAFFLAMSNCIMIMNSNVSRYTSFKMMCICRTVLEGLNKESVSEAFRFAASLCRKRMSEIFRISASILRRVPYDSVIVVGSYFWSVENIKFVNYSKIHYGVLYTLDTSILYLCA